MPYAISSLLDAHFDPRMRREAQCAVMELDHSPLSFYDRHLHTNLLLRRVVSAPSLADDLIRLCENIVSSHSSTGFSDEVTENYYPRSPANSTCSWGLMKYYERLIGNLAGMFASRLYVFTKPTPWKSAILLDSDFPDDYNPFQMKAFTKIAHDRYIMKDPDFDEDYMTATNHYKDKSLAAFSFLPYTEKSEKLLRGMKATSLFRWDEPATTGYPKPTPCRKPADAASGFVKEVVEPKSTTHRTLPARTTKSKASHPTKQVVRPPQRPKETKDQRYNPRHYLQSMWVRACEHDTTFMVFNCGDVERIGIRHRQSQTLFLSGPINPKVPGYAKIHIGLYCAVMEDFLSRHPADSATGLSNGSKKRAAEEAPETESPRKRPRTRMSTQSNATKKPDAKMYTHLNKLDMLLVRLNYGVHKSSAPSCFLRVGSSCVPGLHNSKFTNPTPQKEYEASEYIDLELGERLGKGSCGSGHKGIAEVVLASGEVKRFTLAIKLSFTEDQKHRLRREFSAYEFLARKKYTYGILPVHGLFEDLETGDLALLMDYGGISLRDRDDAIGRDIDNPHQVTMFGPEKVAMKKFVKNIHRTGMIHGDMKPGNTLVNEDGDLFIIDFDMARFRCKLSMPEEGRPDWVDCNAMLAGKFDETW